MDRWFTARELEALALPGLVRSRANLIGFINKRRCRTSGAVSSPPIAQIVRQRDFPGRRGPKPVEIHFLALPRPARDEVLGRMIRGDLA